VGWGAPGTFQAFLLLLVFVSPSTLQNTFQDDSDSGPLRTKRGVAKACRYNNVPWSDCDPQTWMRTKTVQLIAEEDFGPSNGCQETREFSQTCTEKELPNGTRGLLEQQRQWRVRQNFLQMKLRTTHSVLEEAASAVKRAASFYDQRRQLEEDKKSHCEDMEEEVTKLKAEVVQLQERLRKSEEAKTALEQENRGLQEQVKKEEKEFLEEEKEEDTEGQLEKKQFEERLTSCNDSLKDAEDLNRSLKSAGEACRRQVVSLQHFKELSENCLKDIERLRKREVEGAHQVAKTPEKNPEGRQDGFNQLAGVQSELKQCRESLHERLKVKIEQTEKLHTDLNSCEVRLREKTKADLAQIASISSDLNDCKGSLQQYEQDGNVKCETQTKEIRSKCDAFESEVKEVKIKYEACQLKIEHKENSTESCQNGTGTGKDSEIGGYSYIMQILYKYGLI